ncbi:AI-2E family transporter [Helicobacter turcicus]|uniref:AI-2E family transporter n=1 Tax=Helicobacter turcicus TaxID=2867412 RepID=A0ABS7JL20_9HELI|nr:AI-2E family transporter [Helicobacter turcicus]MBX7490095.1 AI-2E family transporter [Helicobacter turcicus]MBX7544954.1 AI-2E family transporter [Helicobacter turcicus]
MRSSGIYFFLIAFMLTLLALFKLYMPFLMNILIAFLLFIATQGIYCALLKCVKSPLLASILMVLMLITLCFVPIFYILLNLANIATNLDLGNFQNFLLDTQIRLTLFSKDLLSYLPTMIQNEVNVWLEQFHTINWGDVVKQGLNLVAKASKNSLHFVSDTLFILVFLFFFYYYGNTLGHYFLELIPFNPKQTQSLYNEVNAVINVVFYSSIFSMVLQGTLFGILMLFYGYNAYLLAVFYGFASLVPVVGGTLVWLPIVGYELYLGNHTNAIIIALYSIIIIATLADNGVKPFIITFINRVLIKTPININEMLIFFAIIAGLTSFGFWGIVLGPTITALFIALLRIYKTLLKSHEH